MVYIGVPRVVIILGFPLNSTKFISLLTEFIVLHVGVLLSSLVSIISIITVINNEGD